MSGNRVHEMDAGLGPAFSAASRLGRERGVKKKSIGTISLRVSADERRRLERAAGGAPLSAYVRDRLFAPDKKSPSVDRVALAKVLAALGKTNLARDLSELSWAVEDGVIVLDDRSVAALRQACAGISEIRRCLKKALGPKG